MRWRVFQQDAVQASYHAVMQLIRTVSVVPLEKEHMMGAGALAPLNLVQTLVNFLGQCCGVDGPGEVFDVDTPRNLVLFTLYMSAPMTLRGGCSVWDILKSSTIFFFSNWDKTVVRAPAGQAPHLVPAVHLISTVHEAYHCCVVHKLDQDVWAALWHGVKGQQGAVSSEHHFKSCMFPCTARAHEHRFTVDGCCWEDI